jgi:hypothetical protein
MNSIRSWRSGTAATPPPATDTPGLRDKLMLLAGRVARLSISIADPSAFAVERSEIAQELRRLARYARHGGNK